MRQPIPAEGMFYRRNPDKHDLCPVCQLHQFVVAQRITGLYTMHTRVARVEDVAYCLHVWRRREETPACLECFEPTGKLLQPKLTDHQLQECLRRA